MPRFNPSVENCENFIKIRPAKPKGIDAAKARKRKGKSEYVRNSKSPKTLANSIKGEE